MQGAAYLAQQWPLFWVVLGAVLGAVIGSFINCVRYRLPRGLSLRSPAHSFCPSCRHPLAAADLIPIFSWLVLRGRCRYCQKPIGTQSLWVEVVATTTGASLAWLALHF